MNILVISDSHGRVSEIERVIEAYKEVKHIFFLGDCIRDIEDMPFIYPDRTFHIVAGNCDGYSTYKTVDVINLFGKKILFTHGHPFEVKLGPERLYEEAVRQQADLVLFGHTHKAVTVYVNGRYFVNPGSLYSGSEGYRSFALIDIAPSGVMPRIVKL